MRKIKRTSLTLHMMLIMIISCIIPAFAADDAVLDAAIKDTAEYMYRTVSNPQVGSTGGELHQDVPLTILPV